MMIDDVIKHYVIIVCEDVSIRPWDAATEIKGAIIVNNSPKNKKSTQNELKAPWLLLLSTANLNFFVLFHFCNFTTL